MEQIKSTLYALNKDGSYQEWKVFTLGDTISVEFGKMGGKIQTKRTVAEPKNVGRSNETSGEEQANLEAISKWEKQHRLGYRETIEELNTTENESPMLAQDYLKRASSIKYPAAYQPKLDGLRCLVKFDEEGLPSFNSRGNKTYPIQGKIPEQVKHIHQQTGFKYLDGEVYIHGLSLQKISSLAKKWRNHEQINAEIEKDYQADLKRREKAIAAGEKVYKNFNKEDILVDILPEPDTMRYGGYESADLEFHIFDIPSSKVFYTDDDNVVCRYEDLYSLEDHLGSHVKIVFTAITESEEDARLLMSQYLVAGYEGLMLRNFFGVYEFGQRSNDLQKWKEFQTTEAKVIASFIDKNYECLLEYVLKSGVKGKVKMKGTHAYRKTNADLIGKFITIEFQSYTDEGVPTFAKGLYVREVDPETWEPLY